jgi:hypothetical protein
MMRRIEKNRELADTDDRAGPYAFPSPLAGRLIKDQAQSAELKVAGESPFKTRCRGNEWNRRI